MERIETTCILLPTMAPMGIEPMSRPLLCSTRSHATTTPRHPIDYEI
jgi:hypothetical protein